MRQWINGRCGLVALCICAFCIYVTSLLRSVTFDMNIRRIYKNNDVKVILYWTKMFGNDTFYMGEGDIFRNCRVSCYATKNRDYIKLEDFDALLFHGNDLDPFPSKHELPQRRDPKQWYVYVNLESPENRALRGTYYEDYFNLTMSYRFDSDILWTYGVVKDLKSGAKVAPFNDTRWSGLEDDAGESAEEEESRLSSIIGSKTKLLAWFVSNCPAKSRRLEYVQELSKHVDVDIYGHCGDKRHACPRSRDCFREVVEPEYFFYLSFENSLCRDYVTEKLYNPLRYDVVPIVYGGANYSLFAPPHSYVNALDFDSPKELAEHLKSLASNVTEYRKYFRWKRRYKVDVTTDFVKCALCEAVHNSKRPKVRDSLSFWHSTNQCPLQRVLGNSYATRQTLKANNRH